MLAEEVYPAKILSDTALTGPVDQELGPRLKALLLAQPLNPLRKLAFRELPSRPPCSERPAGTES